MTALPPPRPPAIAPAERTIGASDPFERSRLERFRELGRSLKTLRQLFEQLLRLEQALYQADPDDLALINGLAETHGAVLMAIAVRPARDVDEFALKALAFAQSPAYITERASLLGAVADAVLAEDKRQLDLSFPSGLPHLNFH